MLGLYHGFFPCRASTYVKNIHNQQTCIKYIFKYSSTSWWRPGLWQKIWGQDRIRRQPTPPTTAFHPQTPSKALHQQPSNRHIAAGLLINFIDCIFYCFPLYCFSICPVCLNTVMYGAHRCCLNLNEFLIGGQPMWMSSPCFSRQNLKQHCNQFEFVCNGS